MTPENYYQNEYQVLPSKSFSASRRNRDLLSSLLSYQLFPDKSPSSCILNPSFRSIIRKSYRRSSGSSANARKVFKTLLDINSVWGGPINPVYDIAYSPVFYHGYRVIAVADELGYLSVVKVGFGGSRNNNNETQNGRNFPEWGNQGVFNRGAESVNAIPPLRSGPDQWFGSADNPLEPESMPPVLYTLAWDSDGSKIATGYGDGSMRIWDLKKASKPSCVSIIVAHEKGLKRVAWCQDTLISCSRTNEILVHDQRMMNPLTNRIDCSQLSSKLTDICVVSDVQVVASASNQSAVHLFDLRNTYKLYKRIKPVESYSLSSPGYTTMKYDKIANDGMVYALGSDSIIRSFNYRSGKDGPSFRVPGGVDFFTKIDVDSFSGILISGGMSESAWGYDLWAANPEKGSHTMPFFELRDGKKIDLVKEGEDENDGKDREKDKENQDAESGVQTGAGRYCSAVALGTRRGYQDCALQIACGGDNSSVLVYD